MLLQELYNDHALLLKKRSSLLCDQAGLPGGYVSVKTISGKQYYYLQRKVGGKVCSEYIKESDLPSVRAGLENRLAINQKIAAADAELEKLEAAALILDKPLHRRLLIHRRCANMDAMPLCERQKSLAFASAMTALEGVPASSDTDRRLASWAQGDESFAELYMDKLRQYRLMEG